MARIADWAEWLALSLGGPGLFFVAFLDSSFLSLPEINDALVILLVIRQKERMAYYALMATLGSITGCFVLYYFGRKGGDAPLLKRLQGRRFERAERLFGRYGGLAVLVAAILPPPAPFKIFVLLAGVAKVPPLQFAGAIGAGRGFRYFGEAYLAVRYGDQAIEFLRDNSQTVALAVAALVLGSGLAYVIWRRRRRPPYNRVPTHGA